MQAMDDMALLREYATQNSEAAFETLVSRRVNFVELILVTGTTTVVFNELRSSQIDRYLSDPDLTEFQKAPPVVVIQPTHIAKMKGRAITLARDETEGGKMVGREVWLNLIISRAYDFKLPHIIFPTDMPTNAYDIAK
jgi:hypothetical protein